jgi:hypothetical protein
MDELAGRMTNVEGTIPDQSLNTDDSVRFFGATFTKGDDLNGSGGLSQIAFTYGGGTDYPHLIRTRHNDGDYTGNAIDFYTNTSQQGNPDDPRHGLTIQNGWLGVNGNTDPQYALDVNGNAGAAANRFFVKDYGRLVFNDNGSYITEQRPGQGYRYDATPTVAVTGSGSGLTLNVQFGVGETSYTTVLLNDVGTGYYIGDQVKIPGDQLGGTTPANDLIVEVTSMALAQPEPFGAGTINVISGTPVGYEDGLHFRVNGLEWTLGNDGTLILNGGIKFGDGTVQTTAATGGGSGLTDRITSGTYSVVVGADGALTLPGGTSKITSTGFSGENVDLVAGPGGWAELASNNGDNAVWVDDAGAYIATNWNHGAKMWAYSTSGQLTAPGHIIPSADLEYDLGSTSSQWRSIYVGTGTIYIGGVALGVNQDNYVTVDGNPIVTVNTAGNITIQGDNILTPVAVSDTAPDANVSEGNLWYNSLDGRTYVSYSGQWVDSNPLVAQPIPQDLDLNSVTFNDLSVQTTAFTPSNVYVEKITFPDSTEQTTAAVPLPEVIDGGNASTWLGPI